MAHKWHFFRAGGVDQVSIRSGADILALPTLDQKLWMALAMPSKDIDVDPVTLEHLDHDGDGRVRAADIIAASEWIGETWKNADDLLKSSDSLPLSAIKDGPVLSAAKRILSDLGKKDARTIALGEVSDVRKAFASTRFNGDGVIIPDTAEEADVKQAIEEVLDGAGGVLDRSGKQGIDQPRVDTYFGDVDKLAAWLEAGEAVRALGDDTAAAADALEKVQAKLDDYFTRCQLAAFDPRAAPFLSSSEDELTALGNLTLSATAERVAKLPIARIEAGGKLPLRGPVNPAWTAALAAFAERAVTPVLGARDTLTRDEHAEVVAKLAGFIAWRAARPVNTASKLGDARIRALAKGDQRKKIAELIASDAALAGEYGAISSVEKLLRLQRDFGRILRNFVNFSDFYSKKDGAFQTGTLYLDGRAFNLAIHVGDAGKHATMAPMAASYLAYCDLTRKGDKRQVAVAVTNGDGDNIFVGRNGVFYDRAGNDWDATVSKIVSNPISVREAFWSPYKKLVRMVEEQVAKRATDAETKSQGQLADTAVKVAGPVPAPAPAAPAPAAAAPGTPPKKGIDIGIIAVISLAISAIVGAIAGMVAMLVGMGGWMPIGILAIILAISGPSMLLAWMKLRQRNLGPILDANGWAVNTRARVNVAFGAALTDIAALPKGSSRSVDDPFADQRSAWRLYTFLILLLILAATWYAGKLDKYLPKQVKSLKVLGKYSPLYKEAAPTPDKAAEKPAPVK